MSSSQIYDLQERFEAMRRQDETVYRCEDYLSPEFQQRQRQQQLVASAPTANPLSSLSSVTSSSSSSSGGGLDKEWRDKICDWKYQVVDHFEFNREVVGVGMSYLDRYLCRKSVNKRTFQLAAMTCLYLACKLYESRKMKLSALIELSRGYFTAEHVTSMEESILSKLGYFVHPPTSTCFVRHYFLLFPYNCCAPNVKHDMEEVAKFMVELSVFSYELVPVRKSSVALAAVLNALDGVDEFRLSVRARENFLENVRQCAKVDPDSDEVFFCREHLRQLYSEGAGSEYQEPADATREATVSPVSVAAFGTFSAGQNQIGNCPDQ